MIMKYVANYNLEIEFMAFARFVIIIFFASTKRNIRKKSKKSFYTVERM